MKGRIIQDARLFLRLEGEKKIRHIKDYETFLKIRDELEDKKRVYLHPLPQEGRVIAEWPEKESNYTIGPERLIWCVPLECNFQHIVDAGFTAIQTYGPYWMKNSQGHIDHGREFLDKAQAHGLKVLFSAKTHVHDMTRAGKSWDRDTCKWMVDEFDSHSALWAWIYMDEADAGSVDPKHGISLATQRAVHDAFRSWTDKPLTTVVRGGTSGWHLVDLSLFDFIMADTYAIDGNPWIWEPGLTWQGALRIVGQQETDYLATHLPNMPIMFVFQSSDFVADQIGNVGTRIPDGKIQEQFDILNQYRIFSAGVGMYPWDGGPFDPEGESVLRTEIKQLFNKIKEG